jgi:DNA-binding LytR/AlgR family response regulator
MIQAISIDDEPLALVIIEEFCKNSDGITLLRTFTDWKEAAEYMRNHPVDLIFLDIQMPGMNGTEWYRKFGQEKMVIFTTAFKEYAVEGFDLDAVDYLLKPIESERFQKAVTKAKDYFHYLHTSDRGGEQNLFVRSEYSLVKIPLPEIEYIETLDDYLKIHLNEKKPVITKMNVKSVMKRLNSKEFVRVHRSYVVRMDRIVSVRGKVIHLKDVEIPIGTKYEREFFEAFGAR